MATKTILKIAFSLVVTPILFSAKRKKLISNKEPITTKACPSVS